MLRLVILACICASSVIAKSAVYPGVWERYKEVFGKNYSPREERIRSSIFAMNAERIRLHNELFERAQVSYSLGINQFTDMTHQEASAMVNGFKMSPNFTRTGSTYLYRDHALPSEVDWRTKGLVTKVKNQKMCLSCWAFAATGAIEGQHKLKTGKLVSLSEQNLVDCSQPEGNAGCFGGLMDYAYSYVKKNHGLDTERSYPYTARTGTCRYRTKFDAATVTGFVDIPKGNERALQHAVATVGPISVAIDTTPEFMNYRSGIMDVPTCNSTKLDHGVLVVGYGRENGKDYWLIKNSYGRTWGTRGYGKMVRNKNNQCGIATKASYPLV